jgi:nitrogen fixation protein FixH
MKKGSLWPWVIGGALALHVVASLVVVAVATSDPSYAVEEDYYQKAIAWDDKRAQDRVNSELGWSLECSATAPARPGDLPELEARISDRTGAPLAGASVALEAFHNSHSDEILRVRLAAAEDGVYRAPTPMRHDGLWELRFTVTRGNDTFTHSEIKHLYVEGEW